jgi:D-serine deaminase-like pyridoxal phosphate-dependent protein
MRRRRSGPSVSTPVVSAGSTPTARRVVGERASPSCARATTSLRRDAVALGTVDMDATALSIAATVISRPTPHQAVIDAGSKTFGLDKGAHGLMVVTTYGHAIGTTGR